MTKENIAALIDHTLLKAEASEEQIKTLCAQAIFYNFASVCTNSCWTKLCSQLLEQSPVKTCAVIGFPLGAMSTEAKAAETSLTCQDGAEEIDMVVNVGWVKSSQWDKVERDINAVVQEAKKHNATVKVILETALLDDAQKQRVCEIAKKVGAAFVKTSTGFSSGGATVQDIALMRATVGPSMGVKASGGIRTLADLEKMVEAGASRIGCSAGKSIIEELEGTSPQTDQTGY